MIDGLQWCIIPLMTEIILALIDVFFLLSTQSGVLAPQGRSCWT